MSKRSVLRTLIAGAVALAVLLPASAAQAEPTLAEIEAQLDQVGEEFAATVEAYNQVNEDLIAAQAASAELQKKLLPLTENVNAANSSVDVIAVAAFKGSHNMATLSVVLGAQSSDTLIDQLTTLRQINKHQQTELAAYADAKAKLGDEQKKIDDTLVAVNAKKTELETKRKKIEGDVKKLEDLKRRAENAGKPKQVAKPSGPPPAVSGLAGVAVTFAYNQIGKPYKWGAAGPNSYDCSGLVLASWKAANKNVALARTAQGQFNGTARVSAAQAAPGDLVFFGSSNSNITHVGIYIGNGRMYHAPTTGRTVEEQSLAKRTNIRGYGRVRLPGA